MKKITAFLLMLVMVLSMVGCGTKNEMPKEPADIIKKAQENSKKAKNVEATATADIKMNVAGQAVAVKLDMDMTVFMDPLKAKVDMTMDLGEELGGKQNVSMYIVKEQDQYVMYMNMAGTWMKQEMDTKTIEESLKKDNEKDMFTTSADQFKIVESDDKDVTALEATITGEEIKKVVDESGAMDQLDTIPGMDENTKNLVKSMFSGLGDIPIKVTVDNKTTNYKTISMDLKPMMQQLLDMVMKSNLMGDEKVEATVDTCDIAIEYKNYDKATDFEVPEEAKNAVDASSALNGVIQ